MKKITALLIACMFTVSAYAAGADHAAANPPFAGKVTATRLNIRVTPGFDTEIIGVLERGDIVTVVNAQDDWYRIALPKKVFVYINKRYVAPQSEKKLVVTAEQVHVRVGPGEKYTSLCTVNAGVMLDKIGEFEDWYSVEPTKDCLGWVFREYVDFYLEYESYLKQVRAEEDMAGAFESIQQEYFAVLNSRDDLEKIRALIARCTDFAQQYPDAKEAKKTHEFLNALGALKKEALLAQENAKIKQQLAQTAKTQKELAETIQQLRRKSQEDLEPVAQGVIQPAGRVINRTWTHKLMDKEGNLICYLKSRNPQLDLNVFLNIPVKIFGEKDHIQEKDMYLVWVDKLKTDIQENDVVKY
jgi:uncharacterized protein YgiM (DUF1202 family)